jgi:hypothetical protein
MYKITLFGKTFVGNNEDFWNPKSLIWFEKGRQSAYGAMFLGGDTVYAQGGMNEKGLVFDGFSLNTDPSIAKPNKLRFDHHVLKNVLRKCQDIDEVYTMLYNYDLSSLRAMFLFVDKSGKYLIVEPDTLIKGSDHKYLLSNFCPSKTPDLNAVKIPFYQKGRKVLDGNVDTTFNYLKSLSDTLHQEWFPLGGTLYTTIYDLNEENIFIYLCHDYKHQAKLNLRDELAKGYHSIDISSLFPRNEIYERLLSYKTPFNSDGMLSVLVSCGAVFLFSAVAFFISFLRKRKNVDRYLKVKLLLVAVNCVLVYYIVTIIGNELIFYFPRRFVTPYIPFLIVVLIFPLIRWNLKVFKEHSWSNFSKGLFALNNLSYLTLIILFSYWLSYRI